MTTKTRALTNNQRLVLSALRQYTGKKGITIRELFETPKYADKMEWPSHYWSGDRDKAAKNVRNNLYQLAERGVVEFTVRTRTEGHLFWVSDRKAAADLLR